MKVADPPLRVARNQAFAGIQLRLRRQVLTLSGIVLGTAFVTLALALRRAAMEAHSDQVTRLTWLAGASLVMCLFGLTNSMLLSVMERIREIGTMKCLGASDGFVVKVFLFEALFLGFLGALVGSLLGALLAIGARVLGELPATPSQAGSAALTGFAIGFLAVALSSLAPAFHAARLPAVSALRTEV